MSRADGYLLRAGFAAGAILATVGMNAPARADCFEGIGCTDSDYYDIDGLVELSCQNLWYVRNRIYDENGLCFKTQRARREFDNSDCWVDDPADVRLNRVERHNIDEIVAAEAENRC